MDTTKRFPQVVQIGNGVQPIAYEMKVQFCFSCGIVGHSAQRCRMDKTRPGKNSSPADPKAMDEGWKIITRRPKPTGQGRQPPRGRTANPQSTPPILAAAPVHGSPVADSSSAQGGAGSEIRPTRSNSRTIWKPKTERAGPCKIVHYHQTHLRFWPKKTPAH